MPSNDNRLLYFRESLQGASTLPTPQSWLDLYPIVKTPAPDEDTPPEYYTAADELTHLEALALKFPHRVGCYKESEGQPPEHFGTLGANGGTPPEGTTHLLYGLPEVPTGQMLMDYGVQLSGLNAQLEAAGEATINPNHFILRNPNGESETEYLRYLKTGELPN